MKISILEQALSLRASGHVKRWHTAQLIGQQTVAEHSGQAVSLLLLLHPDPSVSLIKSMLWHDSSERLVGDMPAPIKRTSKILSDEYEAAENRVMSAIHPLAYEALQDLTEESLAWLRAIDVLELVMLCYDQVMLGNTHFQVIADRAVKYLTESTKTPTLVRDFLAEYLQDPMRSFA